MQPAKRAEIILALTTLVWGSTFVVIKTGLEGMSPFLMLAVRFAIAFILVAVFCARRLHLIDGRMILQGSLLGLFLFAGYSLQTIGLQYTTVAKSGFLTYTFAVLTPPLQFLISRKKLHPGNLTGLAIVIVGIFVFSSPEDVSLNRGDVLTLLCAFAIALHIVFIDRYTRERDPILLAAIQFLVTALASGFATLFFEEVRFRPEPYVFFSVFYLSVFASAIALTLQNRFQHYLTPVKAVIIYSLEPVFASLLALLLFGEWPGSRGTAGAALILGGLLVSELWEYLPALRRRAASGSEQQDGPGRS